MTNIGQKVKNSSKRHSQPLVTINRQKQIVTNKSNKELEELFNGYKKWSPVTIKRQIVTDKLSLE